MNHRKSSRAGFGLLDADVESIVRSQDVIYENAATCWQDGHILGNGDIGAVCYAPYWLEWTINKIDVFDGRMVPVEKPTYQEAMAEAVRRNVTNVRFLNEVVKRDPADTGSPEPLLKSCGQVKIRTMSNEYSWAATLPCRIRQTLSLWEAKDQMVLDLPRAAKTMLDPDPQPAVTSFVCRDVNLLVIRVKRTTNHWWAKKLELCRPYDADYEPARLGRNAAGDCVWFEQKMPDGSSYAMALGVVSTGGVFRYLDLAENDRTRWERRAARGRVLGAGQKGDRAWINVTGDVDVFVAVASSREAPGPLAAAKRIVANSLQKGFARLERAHDRWWAGFWKKSFVQHTDALIEQVWYFGVYQAGSALGRAPVPGLNGLWYGYGDMPSQGLFKAVYTLNQNVQMATMPVFAANHPELGGPFLDTFLNALPRTIHDTRQQFGLPGACFPLEMAFLGGEAYVGALSYSTSGGPYCGLLYVWAYRYTQDRELLRQKVYPFLREVVRFHTAFMDKGADGRYHLPRTVPSEIMTLARDAIIDLALLRPCLELAVEASKLFGVDREERGKWEDVLAHYPDYPLHKGIIVDGLDIPLRHWSDDTYRLYPLVLGHDDRPEVRRLVRNTLTHISPHILRKKNGKDYAMLGRIGWAQFFYALGKLYLGDRRDFLRLLNEQIRSQLKPNGLFPHLMVGHGYQRRGNPRCRELIAALPENNSAVTMLITEMLLQSHNGIIRVFPGISGKVTTRFGDLRAQGAFLVSAEMVRGRVSFVSIRAEIGGPVQIANPWRGRPAQVFRKGKRRQTIAGDILSLKLRKAELLHLTAGPEPEREKAVAWHQASVKVRRCADGTVVTLGKPG